MDDLTRNSRTISTGTAGRFEPERVDAFLRNGWTISSEYASTSIVSTIVCENGHYILYYTYITNPKSKYSERNPIQYGTCRLELDNTMELRGTYWTSRRTIGDIYLKATN
ncbi:MAG TPA: hypothetical protein GX530_10075 [Corynebacteriales bacterium]|nr:hypothetical protein [Mycobacteriales bacterium]